MVLAGLATRGQVRANQSDVLVRFDDSVGVTPILSFAPPQNVDLTFANVALNVVRGVNPSGNPWKIDELTGVIHDDGRISVGGRGLMISGGDLIGQSLTLRIFATLVCELMPPSSSTRPTATHSRSTPFVSTSMATSGSTPP